MLLIYPVFAGINALVFVQYRISLENRSYELSRQIIQRYFIAMAAPFDRSRLVAAGPLLGG